MASRRLARLLRPAAAGLAALALVACSTGVPPTGQVVPVATVPPAPLSPESFEEDSRPSSGLSELDVARGYMFAMSTGNPETVARWVAPRARGKVRRWGQLTDVNVYTTAQPELAVRRGDRRVVPIKVELTGQLDGGRQWTPTTKEASFDLEMSKSGPEWRIANPGDAMWIREDDFQKLYAPLEMFLVHDLRAVTPRLSPVPMFARQPTEPSPVEASEQRAKEALACLLAGPRGRYDNLSSAIPPGTRLRGFSYADGVATVDLSADFATPIAGSGLLRVGQIVWTVSRHIQAAQVQILVEGRPPGPLGVDQFKAGHPWRQTDEPLASLWPQRSSVTDGDDVLFVRDGQIWTVPAQPGQQAKVMALDPARPKSAPTWSPDHRTIAYLLGSGSNRTLYLAPAVGRPYPTGVIGRLSPPSWSPDSDRVYVLDRKRGATELLELNVNTPGVRPVGLPPLPGGLQPTTLSVSPDGAFVLVLARRGDAEPADGGQLFVGRLTRDDGVVGWFEEPIAPGLGTVYSPVWIDPLTVAVIAETDSKDDLGRIWTMQVDGWGPTVVVNDDADGTAPVDIGTQLTADPAGANFVLTVRSDNGASLWMVDRQGNSLRSLTLPGGDKLDTDPSFASR